MHYFIVRCFGVILIMSSWPVYDIYLNSSMLPHWNSSDVSKLIRKDISIIDH